MRIDWAKMVKDRERYVEVPWMLDKLRQLKPAKILDVGFAGSFYQEDIFDIIPPENYYGLDNDPGRIEGRTLWVSQDQREYWQKLVKMHPYIIDDIVNPKIIMNSKYDMVMSISTIEHLVPGGYAGTLNGMNADLAAIANMKKLTDKYLLLTFPVGREKYFYTCRNKNRTVLKKNKQFRQGDYDCMFYDAKRINKIINNWTVLQELYCMVKNGCFMRCKKEEAVTFNHAKARPKTVGMLLLEKPE